MGSSKLPRGRDHTIAAFLARDLAIAITNARARAGNRELARTTTSVRDLDRELARGLNLAIAITNNVDLGLNLARTITTARDLGRYLDRAFTTANDLDRDLHLSGPRCLASELGRARAICYELVGSLAQANQAGPGEVNQRRPLRLASRLLAYASCLLPAGDRIRYLEELRSELAEIARHGSRRRQLSYAVRQMKAMTRLRAELRAPQRRRAAP